MIHLETAQRAWWDFEDRTAGLFQKRMLCGSVRRLRPAVKDVDFVARPVVELLEPGLVAGHVPFFDWVMENADEEAPEGYGPKFVYQPKHHLNNTEVGRVVVRFFLDGIQFDGYMSWGERDFWPQVVIRTGPARFPGHYGPDDKGAKQNIALATRARKMGMKLSMGPGLVKDGEVVGWQSEESFFETLKLPYSGPWYRDDTKWISMIWSSETWEPGSVYRAGEVRSL